MSAPSGRKARLLMARIEREAQRHQRLAARYESSAGKAHEPYATYLFMLSSAHSGAMKQFDAWLDEIEQRLSAKKEPRL